jgi:hypothetical protein
MGKVVVPEVVVAQALGILSYFPDSKDLGPPRFLREAEMDHSKPGAYFDGASQQNGLVRGGGRKGASFTSRKTISTKSKWD